MEQAEETPINEITPSDRSQTAENIAGLLGLGITAIPAYIALKHVPEKDVIVGVIGFSTTLLLGGVAMFSGLRRRRN